MKLKEEQLRKNIREQLIEMYGGGWGDDAGTTSSSGVEGLKKIFVQPFTDVLKTAAAGVETVSSQAQRLMATASTLLVNTLVPFVDKSWQKVKHDDAKRMASIQEKYSEVFSRNHAAIFEGDGKAISFLWNPANFITAEAFMKSPKAFVSILKILSGGNKNMLAKVNVLEKAANKLAQTKNESVNRKEIMLNENAKMAEIISWLKKQNIESDIKDSSIVKQMKVDAIELAKEHLDDIYDLFRGAHDIKNLKDLNSMTGGQLFGSLKIDELDEDVKQQLLDQGKSIIKEKIIGNLKNEMSVVSDNLHSYYLRAIDKIKSY